jgi:GNAT superfamily N-acetyltransferase
MDVEVRRIHAEDWALVREIRLRALADSPDAFRMTLAEEESEPEAVWRERAGGPGLTLVVLEDGRRVAMGGAFAPPDSATAFVWGMWTEPESRGRGYGARLLTDLVTWCRDRCPDVRLHVTESNKVARRLYLAHGFRPTGHWEPLRKGSPLRIEELQYEG